MAAQHGWPMVKLGDVCEINPKLPKKAIADGEEVSFIPMASVLENGTLGDYSLRPFSEVNKGYTQFQRGDVLVAKITPCFQNQKTARAMIRTDFGAGSTEFHVFRPRESLNTDFLHHLLRLPQVFLEGSDSMTGSGGQRRVPAWFFENLTIPLPPLEEQQRIAGIIDAVVAQRTQVNRILTHCDALHAEWIRQFLDNNPTALMPLKDCIDSIESGKSPKCETSPASPDEWGVLKLSAVTTGRFIEEENKALPVPPSDASRREVRPGDVLMTRKNTPELVGAVSLVENVRPKLMFPDLIFRINLSEDRLLPRYFQAVMMSPEYRNKVRSLAGGSAKSMSNISQAKLRELNIPVPSLELQDLFSETSQQIDRIRSTAKMKLALLNELHHSLQTRAFQGLL